MEGFIETSPPDPFSHNFVLLLSNAVSQNLYRILATGMWKLPYLPADRPHPRIGRTPNFQWFSWEKKIVEVEYWDK